ncbi:hypothetical protein HMPREF0156_01130 [Bacteroidetes oral taxon 274 str. F0058]|nr:hypothetical protein HMPREF0156_01130 [Bacteroidetes oral taxon 274 str. F0058]
MKRVIFLSLVAVLLCMGCDISKTILFKSYVTRYFYSENIQLRITDAGNISIYREYMSENKKVKTAIYSFNSKGEEKKIYDELCKIHNDLSYNQKRSYIADPLWGKCSAIDFREIDVVSNKDFDSEHPAGKSLKDVVRFVSISPKQFIDSGYKATFDWKKNEPGFFAKDPMIPSMFQSETGCYFPINGLLSDIGTDEMQMLPVNTHGILFFDKQPTAEKEHSLTVTIYTREGKKFVRNITKVFK